MPVRVIVTGIILIVTAAMLVFVVEFFIPLSAKSDMDIICRDTLLRMETSGGLTASQRANAERELAEKGFLNISVDGTLNARQGESLSLQVEADYTYSKLTGLFVRSRVTQHMTYDKTSMSRKVIN